MKDGTGPVRSLDARYYTDPQVFEVEKAGLLARTWQFACHASQLENAGDYVAFDLNGESLFSIKGKDKKISHGNLIWSPTNYPRYVKKFDVEKARLNQGEL